MSHMPGAIHVRFGAARERVEPYVVHMIEHGHSRATTVPMARPTSPVDYVPPALHQFEIKRRLGGGGMGVVFEARHIVLDRRVALKFTRPGTVRSDRACARLLREAQALARLKHPNVVTLFEVGKAGDEVFLAMELVEGGTLRDWMVRPHDWREIIDVFLAIGAGLVAAHELGLVHRDINPSNIFLDHDGTPKIGDFGLVSGTADDEMWAEGTGPIVLPLLEYGLTTTGRMLGTPAYMAPEQRVAGRIDARADQYAFCVSLHEVLTGRLPHDHDLDPPRAVPRRLRGLIERGLSPEPDDRFPTMLELLAALARARRVRTRSY
jgi:serine/threonine protein kinase